VGLSVKLFQKWYIYYIFLHNPFCIILIFYSFIKQTNLLLFYEEAISLQHYFNFNIVNHDIYDLRLSLY